MESLSQNALNPKPYASGLDCWPGHDTERIRLGFCASLGKPQAMSNPSFNTVKDPLPSSPESRTPKPQNNFKPRRALANTREKLVRPLHEPWNTPVEALRKLVTHNHQSKYEQIQGPKP